MPWSVNSLFAEAAAQNLLSLPWYVNFLVAVATVVVSFALGGYLGRKLRMYDHGWKIGLCLFAFFASAVVLLLGPPLKLGIDLSGGAILVYEIDKTQMKDDSSFDSRKMDELIAAVGRRVNPGGQKEVTIRKYGVEQLEIIIPEKDDTEVKRIEKIISRTGSLEFRILANTRDNKELIEQATADPSVVNIYVGEGDARELKAWWVPLKQGEENKLNYPEIATRKRKLADREVTDVLVMNDDYKVTGRYLRKADAGTDQKGQPCVRFTFDSQGGQLFGGLTGSHLPDKLTDFSYKLGIILDGELYSAPRINSTIFDQGVIEGAFTKEEVQDQVNVLNAGSLPAALTKEPISKLYSGPTLGQDTIQKSTHAMIISSILVPLFMIWYYRFSGFVADIALVLNMLMLFAVMITIKAAFTLTGFAGVALTVGMAVDNNVLIYERLREELERGATLRMAIRNAFQRASATIIDANMTTLIAATVMYVLGSDQVKGFAVTLWLGVAISMFTAVFVSRVIFDIAEKRQWITKIHMLRLIGHTNIDFMSLFRYTLPVSIIITVMAVGVSVQRGKGLFDIDFTGGVSVQTLFDRPQDTATVRKLLENKLEDLAISDVQLSGEEKGLRFVINTSEPDMNKVKKTLMEVFEKDLSRNSVQFSGPKKIEAAAKDAVKEKAAEPAKDNKNKQSRNDLPPSSMLAMAGDGQLARMVLAQAAEKKVDAKKSVEKSVPAKIEAKKADVKKAEVKKAETPKAEVKKADEKKPNAAGATSEAKPVEIPGAKAQPRKISPAEAEKTPAIVVDPFVGGSAADLKFLRAVNYTAAEQLISSAIEKAGLTDNTAAFRLSNPKYVEGDKKEYNEWTLKVMLSPEKTTELLTTLEKQLVDEPIFPASSTIGAAVADNTQQQAILALVASWACMIIYLWVRFQGVAFGLAAVVALIHDVFVMLGAIAVSIYVAPYLGFLMIEPFKINLPIVAAFLTIIGYSVNDTIVIFDRIREVRGKNPDMTRQMINDSVNQTLSRTFLTSFTVLLVVIVLYVAGGEAVHGFAFALIVGVATGTYSSIYIAAPILLWLVGKHKQISGQ